MNEEREYSQEPGAPQEALKWWRGLDGERQIRSSMRRASSVDEVIINRGFYELLFAIRKIDDRAGVSALAGAAGVLAHATAHDADATLGKQMATHFSKGNSGDLRFRRLLSIDSSDRDRLLTEMTRIVRLMRGVVNITDLYSKTYWWNERARRELAYDFYTNFHD